MTLRAAAFLGVLSNSGRGTAPSATTGAGFFDDVVSSGKEALEAWKQEAVETVNHVIALREPARDGADPAVPPAASRPPQPPAVSRAPGVHRFTAGGPAPPRSR
ncbi:hypothetical protein [Streptomyces huiliensis]|uniref:hypothetical protein n=1 Tax=Streptomyces huiliensis TaxID=2876027 RepID=UPI001CBCC851|nr:hypothetical protein [Streptomyces huiliensis]MBZ4319884.1 hypothetical protein [Streptomyces huiliensis]